MVDELNGNKIRLKVFNECVKIDKRKPIYKYKVLELDFPLCDHMRMLKIGKEQIGFIVSPYNLNDAVVPQLQMPDHIVVEMKQLYHPNAQTFAVIHKDYYAKAIEWKIFEVQSV